MKNLILLSAVLIFSSFAVGQQNTDNSFDDKVINAIYPSYYKQVTDSGWVDYFGEDFKATIEGVGTFTIPDKKDISIVMLTWRAENYVFGEMVEFYEIKQLQNKIMVLSKPDDDNARIYYGGGTQRYSDAEITKVLKFSENGIIGFEVEQGSYHFASGTDETTVHLFAIIDDKISEVLEINQYSGFSGFSLKEIKESGDDSMLQDLLTNIAEYVPNEGWRDNIAEGESQYEILKSQTDGMYDIRVNHITYSLSEDKIDTKEQNYIYKWTGDEYKKEE